MTMNGPTRGISRSTFPHGTPWLVKYFLCIITNEEYFSEEEDDTVIDYCDDDIDDKENDGDDVEDDGKFTYCLAKILV